MNLSVWVLVVFLGGHPAQVVGVYPTQHECVSYARLYAPLIKKYQYADGRPMRAVEKCLRHEEFKE